MEPLDFNIPSQQEETPSQATTGVSNTIQKLKSSKIDATQSASSIEKPVTNDNSQQIVSELSSIGKTVTNMHQMLANFIESSVKQSSTASILNIGNRKLESSITDTLRSDDTLNEKRSGSNMNVIEVSLSDTTISSNLNKSAEQQTEQTDLLRENQKILQQIYKAFKPDQLAAQESESESRKSIAEMLKTAISDKKESDKKDADASKEKEEGGGIISSFMEMLGAKNLASKGLSLGKNLLSGGANLLSKGAGLVSSGLGAAGSWLTGGLGLGGLMSSSAGAALTGGLGVGAAVGAGAGVAGAAVGGFKVGDVIAKKAGVGIYGWAQQAGAMAEKAKKDAEKIKDPLGRALFELSALNAQAESEIQESKGGFFGGMKGVGELLGLSDGAGVATEETLKAIEEKKKEVEKLKAERNDQQKQTTQPSSGAQQQSTESDSNQPQTDKSKRTREQQKYGYELDFVSEDEDAILADLKKENPDQEFDRSDIEVEKQMRSMENAKIKQDFEQSNPNHPEVVKMKKWREDYKKSVQGSSKGGEGVTSLPNQKQPTQKNVKEQNVKKEINDFVDKNQREPSEQEIADIRSKHDQTPQPQPTKEDDGKKLTPEQQWYGEIEGLESEDYESIERDMKKQGRAVGPVTTDIERSKRRARNLRRKKEFEKNNPNDPRVIKARQEREDLQNMMPKGGAAGGEGASNLMPARESNEKQATKTLSANTGMKLDEINQSKRQAPTIAPTSVAVDNSSQSIYAGTDFRRPIQPEIGRMT